MMERRQRFPDFPVKHCGHGVKRELPTYRHVRIWEMNCGEVRCSLSERDYFQPEFINEFIDAALDGKVRSGEWLELNRSTLYRAQKENRSTLWRAQKEAAAEARRRRFAR